MKVRCIKNCNINQGGKNVPRLIYNNVYEVFKDNYSIVYTVIDETGQMAPYSKYYFELVDEKMYNPQNGDIVG